MDVPSGAVGRYGFRFTASTTETVLLRFGCGTQAAASAAAAPTQRPPCSASTTCGNCTWAKTDWPRWGLPWAPTYRCSYAAGRHLPRGLASACNRATTTLTPCSVLLRDLSDRFGLRASRYLLGVRQTQYLLVFLMIVIAAIEIIGIDFVNSQHLMMNRFIAPVTLRDAPESLARRCLLLATVAPRPSFLLIGLLAVT